LRAHRLFGIELHADIELPGGLPAARWAGEPAVELRRADARTLPEPPADAGGSWRTRIDGRQLTAASGAGRLDVSWGECRFVFDRAERVLRWSAPDPADRRWQRLVLDTIAYLVALELGREALHAAAVRLPGGGAAALAGRSGAGKSTLTCALLAAGAELVSDDIVVLEPAGGGILAYPGPPLMNVPVGRPLAGRATVDAFGDELWTQVPVVERPAPLEALVLLERRPGAPERTERLAPSPLAVLRHLLAFPPTRDRERRRFELAADVAALVPAHRLVAEAATPPERLAERVLELLLEPAQASVVDGVHA